MRISDWSSDVCSSDLREIGEKSIDPGPQLVANLTGNVAVAARIDAFAIGGRQEIILRAEGPGMDAQPRRMRVTHTLGRRSEARRVGKERVSTCRSRWSQYH